MCVSGCTMCVCLCDECAADTSRKVCNWFSAVETAAHVTCNLLCFFFLYFSVGFVNWPDGRAAVTRATYCCCITSHAYLWFHWISNHGENIVTQFSVWSNVRKRANKTNVGSDYESALIPLAMFVGHHYLHHIRNCLWLIQHNFVSNAMQYAANAPIWITIFVVLR